MEKTKRVINIKSKGKGKNKKIKNAKNLKKTKGENFGSHFFCIELKKSKKN